MFIEDRVNGVLIITKRTLLISTIQKAVATIVALAFVSTAFAPAFAAADTQSVGVWWPSNGAHMVGSQPFKAILNNVSADQYDMYWQVDGGALVPMPTSNDGYPHKEAQVDISSWNWKGKGPYTVTFVAKQGGNIVAQQSVTIYNDGASDNSVLSLPIALPAAVVAPVTKIVTTPTPVASNATGAQAPSSTSAPSTASSNSTQAPANATINTWWPTAQATIAGVQPFKAVVQDMNVDSYKMYWQVDGGALTEMPTANTSEGPHKESDVDVSGWKWNANGKYTLTFIAKDQNGKTIASKDVPITVQQAPGVVAPALTASTLAAAVVQPVSSVASNVANALSGISLYVNPNSDAANQAKSWRQSRPADASLMDMLASQATANWFGNWNGNIYNDVHSVVAAAQAKGSVPVLVAYDIPNRDCGGYSAGGNSPDGYRSWIGSFAAAIGSAKAIVILEPDALANMSCLSQGDQATRISLISDAVNTLKNNGNTAVYIDAGHSGWIDAGAMAATLQKANIGRADGFSLNVSNFQSTSDSVAYGTAISQKVGGKHFVIDTSRNGNGSDGNWCNPNGRAIGNKPTTNTGNSIVDAYLWVKTPGQSDGNCNGGPSAGQWWGDYALNLVKNSH